MSLQHFSKHIFQTYRNLRITIVVLVLSFPVLLIGIGLLQGIELQPSLSSYYHAIPSNIEIPDEIIFLQNTDPKNEEISTFVKEHSYRYFHASPKGRFLRVIFVSFLFAIGVIFYLYKGYTEKENNVLNLAGLFAILVAIFPMQWIDPLSCHDLFKAVYIWKFSIHGISATLLVFCVGYVCIFCKDQTIEEHINDPQLKRRFIIEYNILGGLMIILPIIIILLYLLNGGIISGEECGNNKLVLWVEIIVLIVFARFWWVKNIEFMHIEPYKKAIDMKNKK